MTTPATLVSITNRALQGIGTRTTIASMTENSNEAIQANLVIETLRDELIRMAPWNCANNYANLTYITSAPGTPENPNLPTALWSKGQPAPPWAYEYQYPPDCLRPLWIVPQYQTGFSGGVPITTAVTGGAAQYWTGPPVRFKVGVDQLITLTGIAVASGGTGYAAGDKITLAKPANGLGAPAQLLVIAAPAGVISSVQVFSIFGPGTIPGPFGGSYFTVPPSPISQGSTTGSGTGATFTVTSTQSLDQRVILTNQENALLCYLRQVTDISVMDPMFVEAWVKILSARLAFQLTGDTATANLKTAEANGYIIQARTADGNEGLTVNDVTPDWIRIRGITWAGETGMPNSEYDWGPIFSAY